MRETGLGERGENHKQLQQEKVVEERRGGIIGKKEPGQARDPVW